MLITFQKSSLLAPHDIFFQKNPRCQCITASSTWIILDPRNALRHRPHWSRCPGQLGASVRLFNLFTWIYARGYAIFCFLASHLVSKNTAGRRPSIRVRSANGALVYTSIRIHSHHRVHPRRSGLRLQCGCSTINTVTSGDTCQWFQTGRRRKFRVSFSLLPKPAPLSSSHSV